MKKIINSLKNHTTAIIASSVVILILAVVELFTLICLQYFDNLSHASSLDIIEPEFTGAIEATSDDLLFVTLSSTNEIFTQKTDEKKLEDEEKDKEEEVKAEEEAKKEAEKKQEKEKEKDTDKTKEQAKETEKNKSQNTNTKNNQNASSYYIKINKSANTITVYTKDSNGNYTVPYKAMVCSTRICFSK